MKALSKLTAGVGALAAVGCTGGQHRSVVLAEQTGDYLRASGYRVSVAHRDLALAIRPDGELVNADPLADAEGGAA